MWYAFLLGTLFRLSLSFSSLPLKQLNRISSREIYLRPRLSVRFLSALYNSNESQS